MKDKIVEASIELFNSMGTHRVTTNHIIDKLGISPGTFYYHFKNKEEIIRRIFNRITEEFSGLFAENNPEYGMKESASAIRNIYLLYYRYRFFYYDISMLLDRDEELAVKYRENYKLKVAKIRELTIALETGGFLKKFGSDEERERFIENQWILNDYWLTFRKATGGLSETEIIESGVKSYLAYLKPYLTEAAAIEMERVL
jgi:AcrR family transcriptional regulator